MKQKKKKYMYIYIYIYIIHACIIIFILYSLPYFIRIIAVILKYSVCLLWFYVVSLLYTRLSENSSDELMLPNYHVTDFK